MGGAHAAHNLLHTFGEGKSVIWVTERLVGLGSPLDIPGGHPGGSMGAALLDAPTIKVLQIALLLLGRLGKFRGGAGACAGAWAATALCRHSTGSSWCSSA